MKKILNTFVSLVTLVSFTSCSLFSTKTQTVNVNTAPSGAKITANGSYAGTAPLQIEAKRNKTLSLLAEKPGYNPATYTVDRKLSQTAMLDIVGGVFLALPFFGLLGAGAWDLKEENVVIPMSKN